eukprot:TRINITY_DN8109_c0_g1_i2.p1 TRINITY_DN8109_c0_g1~~TRINITY_DN8109_c0_g1_i2.p1  ORF type:complete len:1639 (-),score=314.19 TRINITY_DN8109_c0_g1_i2:55-4971(-)
MDQSSHWKRILAIWVFCVILINATPPGFTVEYLNLDFEDIQLGNVLGYWLVVKFDQDMYIDPRCENNEPTQYLRCCSDDEDDMVDNVTVCYKPTGINVTCIDATTSVTELSRQAKDFQSTGLSEKKFQMFVSNPESCSTVSYGLKSFQGWAKSDINIKDVHNVQVNRETTEKGFSICCEKIQRLAEGGWEGVVDITVYSGFYGDSEGEARYEFELYPDPTKLPLQPFHHIPSIVIELDGEELVTEFDCEGLNFNTYDSQFIFNLKDEDYKFLCHRQYPAHENGLRNFYKRGLSTEEEDYQDNVIAFRLDGSKFGKELFDENSESITFNIGRVRNADGEEPDRSGIPTLKELECSHEQMEQLKEEYKSYLSVLPGDDPAVQNEILYKWRALNSIFLSQSWMGCHYTLLKKLSETTLETESISTNICIYPINSDEFLNDPCCSPVADQCCFEKQVDVGVPKRTSSSDFIYNQCAFDSLHCASESINNYFNALGSTIRHGYTTEQKSCDYLSTYNSFLASVQNNHFPDLYSECREHPKNDVCKKDSDCLVPGSKCVSSHGVSWKNYPWQNLHCTVLCEQDSDCYGVEKCIEFGGGKVCDLANYYVDNLDILNDEPTQILIECMVDNIIKRDPYVYIQLLNYYELENDISVEDLSTTIYDNAVSEDCSDWIDTNDFKDVCSDVETCSWLLCNSNRDFWCHGDTQFYDVYYHGCDNPAWNENETSYCSLETPTFIQYDQTQSGNCRLGAFSYDSNFDLLIEECEKEGGRVDDLLLQCWTGPYETQQECLKPEYCPESNMISLDRWRSENLFSEVKGANEGTFCLATCIINSVTETECNGLSNVLSVLWYNDTESCHVGAFDSYECKSFAELYNISVYYFPGALYLPPLRDTEETCNSFCRSDNTLDTKELCDEGFHCSNPYCENCDQEECEASGFCEIPPGCYYPYDKDGNCDLNKHQHWTPIGCVFRERTFIDYVFYGFNQLSCEYTNGTYMSYDEWLDIDEEECSRLSNVCQNTAEVVITPEYQKPQWIDQVGEVECNTCGGHMINYSKWNRGQWLKNSDTNEWHELNWINRSMVTLYPDGPTTPILNKEMWQSAYQKAVELRKADILKNGMQCKLQLLEYVTEATCMCYSNSTSDINQCISADTDEISSNGLKIAQEKICSLIPYELFFNQFGHITVDETFELPHFGCFDLEVNFYPLSQFSYLDKISLSRTSVKEGKVDKFINVKNENNVVIGEIITGGARFSTIGAKPEDINGINICLSIPKSHINNGNEYTHFDIGYVKGRTVEQVIPMNLHIDGNQSSICVDLNITTSTTILFVLEVLENTDLSYQDTLSDTIKTLLISGLVIYFILLIFDAYVFARHVLDYRFRTTHFISIPRLSLFLLSVFIIDRIAFFFFIYYDLLYTRPLLETFFSELPPLLFMSIYLCVIFNWLEMNRSKIVNLNNAKNSVLGIKKYLPALVLTVLAMIIIFIAIIVLYSTIPEEQQKITCLNYDDLTKLSNKETIAIAYTVIYGSLVTFLLILSTIHGKKIMQHFNVGKETAYSSHMKAKVLKMLVISDIFLICQFIYLVILVVLDSSSPEFSFVYMLITDTIPLVFFLNMYRVSSNKTNKTLRTTTSNKNSKKSTMNTKLENIRTEERG